MGLSTVRRLASSILNVGESRVRFKESKRAGEALTRDDVRALIKEGVIYCLPKKGVGRARAQFKAGRIHSGRRRGAGSRKGAEYALLKSKERWMSKVRAQRMLVSSLRDRMVEHSYEKVYSMIKGNSFKNNKTLLQYLSEKKLLKVK